MKYIINETQFLLSREFIKESTEKENLSPSQIKLLKILDSVQKGYISWDNIDDFFGGFEVLLKKLSDENLLHYMNPFDPMWEDEQNMVFYTFYENDSSFIWKIVDQYLSDVLKENGKYYMKADPDDLSDFFSFTWRSDIGRDGIDSIISGEYDYDVFDITENEYRDVYEELDSKNKQLVNEVIKKDLLEVKKLNVTHKTPSLFDEIASEQNHEDYIELTSEIIDRLLSDENCVEYIIMEESDELKQNLYSLYSRCYQDELHHSWYQSVMGELEGYVIDNYKRSEYTYERKVYDKDGNASMKKMYGDKYEATNCIYDVVTEWLNENKDNNITIQYFGTYRGLLNHLIDQGVRDKLSAPRLDDYADHRKVTKCVNENIRDYF